MRLHLVNEDPQLLLAFLQGFLHLRHQLLLRHLADVSVHLLTAVDHFLDVTLLTPIYTAGFLCLDVRFYDQQSKTNLNNTFMLIHKNVQLK